MAGSDEDGMKKITRQRLTIRRETIAILESEALRRAKGGYITWTGGDQTTTQGPTGAPDVCMPASIGNPSCTCPSYNGCPSDCPTLATNCGPCP